MKMNRIAAAALAGTMLTAPVLAEDAAWTPPTVTQEEMDAVQLGERILMRGTEGETVANANKATFFAAEAVFEREASAAAVAVVGQVGRAARVEHRLQFFQKLGVLGSSRVIQSVFNLQ